MLVRRPAAGNRIYCARSLQERQRSQSAEAWAHGQVTPATASLLIAISEKIGGWANQNDNADGYILFDPFLTPQKYPEETRYWKEKSKQEK